MSFPRFRFLTLENKEFDFQINLLNSFQVYSSTVHLWYSGTNLPWWVAILALSAA